MFHQASDNNREPNLLLCCNFLPLELRIGHSDLARVKNICLIETKLNFNKEQEVQCTQQFKKIKSHFLMLM